MKKTIKRTLATLLAVLFTLGVGAAGASAADVEEVPIPQADFVPVTDISFSFPSFTAGTTKYLNLSSTVSPYNATNRAITWSIVSAGTTGASLSGDQLRAVRAGTVTVKATIANGIAAGSNFTKDFSITVEFVPVTGITGVPGYAAVGQTSLGVTVSPSNATKKTITWSVVSAGTTGASIDWLGRLNTTGTGTATIRATIADGVAIGTDYTQTFPIIVEIPISGISGVPSSAITGIPVALPGMANPSNATNRTIVWSVYSAGATGAVIAGNTFTATAAGSATIKATVASGSLGTNYEEYFTITVGAYIAVTSITYSHMTDLYTTYYKPEVYAGFPVKPTGTVNPLDATKKSITWSIVNAGTTGASISGNTLYTTAAGMATVRATIVDGKAIGVDYTQEFTVTVNPPSAVTDITGVPTYTHVGAQLTLNGTVWPIYAANKTIIWSIIDAGTTNASLSGNRLSATATGTVKVRATIANGNADGTDYTDEFDIEVRSAIIPVTGITGVPNPYRVKVGTNLSLTQMVTVNPFNATYKDIIWEFKPSGIRSSSGNISLTQPGTVTATATIANGIASGQDYTQNFTITVYETIGDTEWEKTTFNLFLYYVAFGWIWMRFI